MQYGSSSRAEIKTSMALVNMQTTAPPALKAGMPDARITVCGPRDAVITGAANYESKPYIVHIQDSSYVTLAGLTLRVGIKGMHGYPHNTACV